MPQTRSVRTTVSSCAIFMLASGSSALAGDFFGHNANSIAGGARWDAAPRVIGANERSISGGLRYTMDGQSFQAYRDLFQWNVVPTVPQFTAAVQQAFDAWKAVDPTSGLGSNLSFVSDLATAPVANAGFGGGANQNGAEIDLVARNAGDAGTRAETWFNFIGSTVTLTSGTANYPGSFAISGSDVYMNNNPGAVYTLDLFRRLLTHELGHAIGLGDVENANASNEFLDDNYNGASNATALATLTNSWAALVNPLNPAASPLTLYTVSSGSPGINTTGVDILMESNGLGIAAGNPVTNLVPLTNDDYGTRQFLYPYVPEPSAAIGLLGAGVVSLVRRRRA